MKVTMDRYEADWNIVKKGWEAHVLGKGRLFGTAADAVRTYYDEDPDITDQYMDSFVISRDSGEPVGPIVDGDVVIFFNYRGDRAIEISRAFTEKDFHGFDRGKGLPWI
jgi:2,3-bisphosphoglycerate-independent phosphoglycerate mutase